MKVWRAREGEGKEDEEAWDLLPCLPFDFYQTIKQQDVNKGKNSKMLTLYKLVQKSKSKNLLSINFHNKFLEL
jgi:hypothetical protein